MATASKPAPASSPRTASAWSQPCSRSSQPPSARCAGAIAAARIRRVYYGAGDPKSGGVDNGARVFAHPQAHHAPEVYSGIAEAECAALLRAFFAARRRA